jgi:predicted Holliday junction resolvase-like endonuclease
MRIIIILLIVVGIAAMVRALFHVRQIEKKIQQEAEEQDRARRAAGRHPSTRRVIGPEDDPEFGA